MNNTILNGVEDTLYIPLAARVEASRRFPYFFTDEKSLECESLPQIKEVNSKSNEYSMLASVSRYYVMDNMIKTFINENPNGVIVSLGVGLETMNYRLSDLKTTFYSVDFPKVIETRENLLGTAKNEICIKCDINDMAWTEKIDKTVPVLLVASGVFQYFKAEKVSEFFKNIKCKFNNVQLVFDATNKVGIKYAQKYVKKTGNKSAMMYFYINDINDFCSKEKVTLLEEKWFFKQARAMLKGLKLYTKIAMRVVDNKKRATIYWLKLN